MAAVALAMKKSSYSVKRFRKVIHPFIQMNHLQTKAPRTNFYFFVFYFLRELNVQEKQIV